MRADTSRCARDASVILTHVPPSAGEPTSSRRAEEEENARGAQVINAAPNAGPQLELLRRARLLSERWPAGDGLAGRRACRCGRAQRRDASCAPVHVLQPRELIRVSATNCRAPRWTWPQAAADWLEWPCATLSRFLHATDEDPRRAFKCTACKSHRTQFRIFLLTAPSKWLGAFNSLLVLLLTRNAALSPRRADRKSAGACLRPRLQSDKCSPRETCARLELGARAQLNGFGRVACGAATSTGADWLIIRGRHFVARRRQFRANNLEIPLGRRRRLEVAQIGAAAAASGKCSGGETLASCGANARRQLAPPVPLAPPRPPSRVGADANLRAPRPFERGPSWFYCIARASV